MKTQSMTIPIAKAKQEIAIPAKMANRHGLIAGATGTGKTVSVLQSIIGVLIAFPVRFLMRLK